MCTKLPINPLKERLRWVMPIIKHEVKLKDVALVFPGDKRTLERWAASYKQHRRVGLIPKSTRPLSQPNETPIRIKERVIEMRNEILGIIKANIEDLDPKEERNFRWKF